VTTILYVAGAGRSGSTLLAAVLGQTPGVIDVGELWKVWRVMEQPGRRCGCGVELVACPFWRSVAEAAPGVFESDAELVATMERIGRARGSVALWGQLRTGRAGTEAYAERLGRVYDAIAEVSGARVIVDSSKMPGPAMVVEGMAGRDVRVLHLTRDPRAVAASWTTRKVDPAGTFHLEARDPGDVAKAWMTRAVATELLVRGGADGYLRESYERFAREPEGVVDEVLSFIGEPTGSPAFVGPSTVLLDATHSTGGNPGRFDRTEQKISLDDRWRTVLDAHDRRKVERMTTPLRQLYGYR
jgi:hypothetical protein